jgi:TonB family protein
MKKFKGIRLLKKIALSVYALFMFCTFCFAQKKEVKYYDGPNLRNQVSQQKAKVSWERIHNPDGSITTLIKKIKRDKILNSETYKGEEPTGIWIYQMGITTGEKDYNFQLIYAEIDCTNNSDFKMGKNFYEDAPSLGYQAPKIATGDKTISKFLGKNMRYPSKARDNNITGKVQTAFMINKDGTIENLVVEKGTNVLLDKEAIRVLRKLKFSSPAISNGKPISVCVHLPIGFELQQ